MRALEDHASRDASPASSSSSAAIPSPNVTIESGKPIRTSGHGLPALNSVFELAPVGRRLAKFIGDELVGYRLAKRDGIFLPQHARANLLALPRCRHVTPFREIVEILDLPLLEKTADVITHVVVQQPSPGDDQPNRDRAIAMQSFEIFKVAIKERILVVPFNLQGDTRPVVESADVIDLMRLEHC
jgi:hypothetical protein